MTYFQSGPYWKFVIFVTPGVVLLDSNQASDQIQVAETRVLFTLIGAVLAVLIAVMIRELAKKGSLFGVVDVVILISPVNRIRGESRNTHRHVTSAVIGVVPDPLATAGNNPLAGINQRWPVLGVNNQ